MKTKLIAVLAALMIAAAPAVAGIDEGGNRGIDEGGTKGIDEGGTKGIDEGGTRGIDEGGTKGIDEGGNKAGCQLKIGDLRVICLELPDFFRT